MKRSIAIIFSILLSLPLLVLEGTISIEKYMIRREVKHRLMDMLDNNELVKISLSKKDASRTLRWKKKNEFEFQGRMYDVVRSEESDNNITYWCWPDSDESYLNQLLSSVINQSSHNKKSEKSEILISFMKSLYFIDKTYILQPSAEYKALTYFTKTNHYRSQKFEPATPPPDYKYLS